jgi:uncharacterized protein YbjT (DUF2867 family)
MEPTAPGMTAPSSAPDNVATGAGRVALVAGATGLVGRELLARLLDDPALASVISLGRRAPAVVHPRLRALTVDFAALPALPAVDEAYIALGTTIKVAGSEAAFRAVDLDAVVAVAQAARVAGAGRCGIVGAMGPDVNSRVFYNRVKGEMEAAVKAIGYPCLVIARPSLLTGDRASLGQPGRSGERMAQLAMKLDWLIPANYRAIGADKVARALHAAVRAGEPGVHILPSGLMQQA